MQPQAAKAMAPRALTTVDSILTLPETLQVGGRHPAVVECCRSPIENPWNWLKRRKPLVPPCRSSVVQSNRATSHQVPELRLRRCNWLTARFPRAMPRRHIKSTSWTGNLLP